MFSGGWAGPTPLPLENYACGKRDCTGKECLSYQQVWGAFREHLERNPPDKETRNPPSPAAAPGSMAAPHRDAAARRTDVQAAGYGVAEPAAMAVANGCGTGEHAKDPGVPFVAAVSPTRKGKAGAGTSLGCLVDREVLQGGW